MSKILLAVIILNQVSSFAGEPDFLPIIRKSTQKLNPANEKDFPRILDLIASSLVGKPYQLGPLGEGPGSEHPEPLYRLDVFDCTTFIETVMANAYCFRAGTGMGRCLERRMREIRYAGGFVGFRERNHFPELDWLPNNSNAGRLKSLEQDFFQGNWKDASVSIDREQWLKERMKSNPLHLQLKEKSARIAYLPVPLFFRKNELNEEAVRAIEKKAEEAISELQGESEPLSEEDAKNFKAKAKFRADLAYLKAAYAPIPEMLSQIPSGTILSLIRIPEKSPEKAKISTIVAHQGLIVQREDGPHFIHAAANMHKVKDQKLGDYLLRYVRSANFRGISLHRILWKLAP